MFRNTVPSAAAVLVALAAFVPSPATSAGPAATDWAMNATVIEACSCPMFCQCYFNAQPAGHVGAGDRAHGAKHYCRANNAYKVNKRHYGTTSLDGAKFWIATALGGDFSAKPPQMDWAVLYFDKSLTPAQREGIG